MAVEGDEELWRISARVCALNNIDYGVFIEDVKNQIEPVLQEVRDEAIKAKAAKAAKTAAAAVNEITLVAHAEPVASTDKPATTSKTAATGRPQRMRPRH